MATPVWTFARLDRSLKTNEYASLVKGGCQFCESLHISLLTQNNKNTKTRKRSAKYQDQAGQLSCLSCTNGVPNEYQTACIDHCSAGSYTDSDRTFCKFCASGSYSPHNGALSCEPCESGKFESEEGRCNNFRVCCCVVASALAT